MWLLLLVSIRYYDFCWVVHSYFFLLHSRIPQSSISPICQFVTLEVSLGKINTLCQYLLNLLFQSSSCYRVRTSQWCGALNVVEVCLLIRFYSLISSSLISFNLFFGNRDSLCLILFSLPWTCRGIRTNHVSHFIHSCLFFLYSWMQSISSVLT
jgi:hypothetical protein